MKKMISAVILTLLFCNMKNDTSTPVIDVLSASESELKNISDIAADVEYIPLETADNEPLGMIRNIVTSNRSIFFSTVDKIYCFDKKGKYLRKLSRLGRGPEEYSNLYSFDVSQDDSILAVISSHCLMLYKKERSDYTFLRKLNYYPSRIDFIPGQENILLTYGTSIGTEPFRHLLINYKGDTINTRTNNSRIVNSGPTLSLFFENISFKFNYKMHFKELLNDTVFSIEPYSKIRPYLIFDTKGKIPSPNDRANGQYFKDHMSEFIMIDNIMEVPRYLVFSFLYQKAKHYRIYDKVANKKYDINSKSWIKDNISGGTGFKPLFSDDSRLYSWVEALTLKNYVTSETFKSSKVNNPDKKKALEKLVETIDENDNPILIVVFPKNK